ncbi:zinc finger protein 37-like isoform X2 [Dreissena polymorpha]|uniref:zinc finger protein 37-like isoform X2 n=1 Tax=Dreissena polymorpha TaxID=45954 RepID=UPI002263FE29|nr:zinc finger protein 37-like isoform X2 [Dreissena polymorpha]
MHRLGVGENAHRILCKNNRLGQRKVHVLKKSPYVGCTLSGLPIMQAFKAQFTEPTGGSVSQRCGIFLIVPFVPATGSNVVDMTPLTATREAVVDSNVYLQELMSDKAVIEDKHMDATTRNDNLTGKRKQDIIIKKDLDDSVSDTLNVEDITAATSLTLQAPHMNNQGEKRTRTISMTYEDPKCEISDENSYLGLSDKECDFELSDENPDFALCDKEEGQSNNESCQKEMKLLENFIQNKSKVRYLDEEDEKLDKKFESRRKSTRLRSKGYRPDFKALELPDDSDEETNDKHFGDLAKDGSSEDDITVDDITDTMSMTVRACKMNRGRKRKKNISETEEDPDFELSDENPDFGASEKESDSEPSKTDPDFQLQLHSKDGELFESRDNTIKKKVVSSKNPCVRKVPKVKKKKIMIETCVGITGDMKMKLKSELKWKSIKLEDHADKYTVVKVPSVSQKDRNLDVFEELFSCLVCKGFKAEDKTAFEEHIEEHVNGILRCRICDYESKNQAYVKKHQKDAHPNLTKRSVIMGYSCELCGVELKELNIYRNHMAKQHNEARWYCNHCEAVYFKQSVLIKHKCEVHSEIMAYCKKCKLRFLDMTKDCYEQHVANCQGASEDNVKKGWLCPDCGKRYCSKIDLTRHIKHVHCNIRDFQCPKCSYTAKCSGNFKNHMRTHDGIKPYKCDQCAMSFVQAFQLTSHMRTHTGTKPFKCDQCSYAAAWNVQLKEHRGIHGLPTAIKCVACNVLFKNARVLNAHTKKEHPS